MVKKIKTVLVSGEWWQGLIGKGNEEIFSDDGNNAPYLDEGWVMKVYELSKFR